MLYERSSARVLLPFVLMTSILPLAFASQAVLAGNQTIRVPVSLGVTSRDDDALYVQTVFDKVLKQVSDKVNMTFAYVKECVFFVICGAVYKSHENNCIVSGPMMKNTGCDVLQTGSTARGTCNSSACVSTLHSRSGGISSCAKTERERRRLAAWKPPRSAL